MSFRQQVLFWIAILAALVVAIWLLNAILLPFIAGLVLAYFLDPVADRLQRLGLPRVFAVLIMVVASIVFSVLAVVILAPILGDQLYRLVERLPGYAATLAARLDQVAPDWLKQMLQSPEAGIPQPADLAARAAGWLGAVVASLWSGGLALVNLLSLIVVTPVVAFYLLKDWDRMVAAVDSWLPREHQGTIRRLARDIDQAIAGFIRGQGLVCLFLATFYAVGLIVVGLNFGLLIGLTAGLLAFIPLVGSAIGAVLSLGMALVQFWPDWVSVVAVGGIFAAGQFIEGNFLSPKLVGDRVGLHPVWMIFALFAFGYMFGLVGVLLAVPLAAAAGVLCRFALRQYLASRLYRGEPGPEPPAADAAPPPP